MLVKDVHFIILKIMNREAQLSSSKVGAAGKKRATRVDFSKLTWGTLRKYEYYFRVADPIAQAHANLPPH